MIDMNVGPWAMILGEDALTYLARLIDTPHRQQHDDLTKLRIATLTDEKRLMQMRLQLTFHLLCLNLDTTRTNHIVLAPEDSETTIG